MKTEIVRRVLRSRVAYFLHTGVGVIAMVVLSCTSAAAMPPDPRCAGAQDVGVGSTLVNTASNTGNVVVRTQAGTTTIWGARWYRFIPTTTGLYTLSVCGSIGDTKMALAASCPDAGVVFDSIAYNDDACACTSGCGSTGTDNWSSRLRIDNSDMPLTQELVAGQPYYVVIGGWGNGTGAISASLEIGSLDCDARQLSTTSPQLVPYSFSSPGVWTATGIPASSQGAMLTVTARGQLGGTTRFLTVKIDGITLATNVFGAGSGAGICTTNASTVAIPITPAQFAQLTADGQLEVRIEPSINASSTGCANAELQVRLSYRRDIVDCDENFADDECQLLWGATLFDCDLNGLIDSCEASVPGVDCDGNNVPDVCDIEAGAEDTNENSRLDSCEVNYGDLNLDGVVNGTDLAGLLALWGFTNPPYGDFDGNGVIGGGDLSFLLARWGQVPWPTLTLVNPVGGPTAGGTLITITGTNLTGATSVRIGDRIATNVQVINATTVRAIAPAGTTGAKSVSVFTSTGVATSIGGYTYANPIVPTWATMVESFPNPEVVSNSALRVRVMGTGLAWRVRDTATQIEFVLIPPGTYQRGCSPSLQYGCDSWEQPVHQVTLTQPFYLGRYEVTQAQWQARMGSNPSSFQSASTQVPADQVPNRPVERVSWNMIQGFLSATGMRLPTEAEWEYAYRAGTMTAFHSMPGYPNGTNDDSLVGNIAWFNGNSSNQTRPVGGKASNGFGLHDMAGNVDEWVNDWFGTYPNAAQVDPVGPASGWFRVIRGGSWPYSTIWVRSSARDDFAPEYTGSDVGFRVARNP